MCANRLIMVSSYLLFILFIIIALAYLVSVLFIQTAFAGMPKLLNHYKNVSLTYKGFVKS